jgi:CheY-like chemotaxis protein
VKFPQLKREMLRILGEGGDPTDREEYPHVVLEENGVCALDDLQCITGRILLAEDNSVNRKLVERMLAKCGVEVTSVTNGLEAAHAASETEFDLVLMDCQMPELDGYEATKWIRALNPPHCNVPVIALTANAMVGDRRRCLAAGMDDYLSKPLQKERFYSVLREWLAGNRHRT